MRLQTITLTLLPLFTITTALNVPHPIPTPNINVDTTVADPPAGFGCLVRFLLFFFIYIRKRGLIFVSQYCERHCGGAGGGSSSAQASATPIAWPYCNECKYLVCWGAGMSIYIYIQMDMQLYGCVGGGGWFLSRWLVWFYEGDLLVDSIYSVYRINPGPISSTCRTKYTKNAEPWELPW